MITQEDFDINYPERYERGYLIIRTTYTPSNGGGDEAEIEANAQIATAVRRIIESKGDIVKGAVVETVANDVSTFYIIVSLRVTMEAWGQDPLNKVKDLILQELRDSGGLQTNSSITVDEVDVAKGRAVPTGLQGPP